MNGEQRASVVCHLGNGATLREAASLVSAAWRDFVADWAAGRTDSEGGHESDEAAWYREAQASRARKRATLRALAATTAGTRESADLLRVLEALESEDEPEAVEDVTPNLTAWTPRAFELADELLRELTAVVAT